MVREARERGLLSDEHFTVDGTLLEAWASQKSFQPKDGPPRSGTNFRGERRSNETHESTTDPDARQAKKGRGKEAKPSYEGSALMDNRYGLMVGAEVAIVTGRSERETALEMVDPSPRPCMTWSEYAP